MYLTVRAPLPAVEEYFKGFCAGLSHALYHSILRQSGEKWLHLHHWGCKAASQQNLMPVQSLDKKKSCWQKERPVVKTYEGDFSAPAQGSSQQIK